MVSRVTVPIVGVGIAFKRLKITQWSGKHETAWDLCQSAGRPQHAEQTLNAPSCKWEMVDLVSRAILSKGLYNWSIKKIKRITSFSGDCCRWQQENLSNVSSLWLAWFITAFPLLPKYEALWINAFSKSKAPGWMSHQSNLFFSLCPENPQIWAQCNNLKQLLHFQKSVFQYKACSWVTGTRSASTTWRQLAAWVTLHVIVECDRLRIARSTSSCYENEVNQQLSIHLLA